MSRRTTIRSTATLAVLANGAVVFAWDDESKIGGDASWSAIKARIFRDEIVGTEGPDSLTGGAAADILLGLAGDDLLDGGAGADRTIGGPGDDIHVVDDEGDVVEENPGEGSDEIRTGLAAYSLAGLADVEGLTGLSDSGQALTGNALANDIAGGGGDDVMDGGAGADTMAGGAGDDVYLVDDEGDQAVEPAGDGGLDTVLSTISFTLGAGMENLQLSGTAALAIGNDLANQLGGNAFGNRLDGAAGADTMAGGAGDDVYIVDHIGDRVIEVWAADSNDLVYATVSFTLPDHAETLFLDFGPAGAAAIDGTGNTLANCDSRQRRRQYARRRRSARTRWKAGSATTSIVVDNAGDVVGRGGGRGHRPGAQLGHLHPRRRGREPDPDRHRRDQRHRQCARQPRSPAMRAPTRSTAAPGPTR